MEQKIVFFGSGEYSIPVIEMLSFHGLVYVLTTEIEGPLIEYLKSKKIPYSSTHVTDDKNISKNELWNKIEQLNPTLGVLASFGAIIPQKIIDMFKNGIWNIHPSLLPKYKGPSPIQSTILSGDVETGVTIITLDDQIDHGPILAQEMISLLGTETTYHLKNMLFEKGGEMIEQLLLGLENGDPILKTPQNHKHESFTEKITKEHGKISLDKPPSQETLYRMIRAYYPWPTVWFLWKQENGKEKLVKLLPEEKIQVEGKRPMSYREFINGYQEEGKLLLTKLKLR